MPTILIAFIATYALVHIGFALALKPVRMELVRIAEELLVDRIPPEAKKEVNRLVDTCVSYKVAALFPFAVVGVIAMEVVDFPCDDQVLPGDERFKKLNTLYFLSVLGNFPLAALVSLPFLLILALISLAKGRAIKTEALDRPVHFASFASAAN